MNFGVTVLKGAVLFSAMFFLGKRAVPWLFEKIGRSQELLFLLSLAWLFVVAALVSRVGFSIEIAGFLAGFALANSSEHFQIATKMRPLRDFFILGFFVFLGSSIGISHFAGFSVPMAALLGFVLVVKPLIVLGILYESFLHPITILSGLPSAGIGALLALWACGDELNIYAFIGIIMLIGIVKKNAIMMIDFAIERQRNHGWSAGAAILRAAQLRFRPIMMTTAAAIGGAIPLALGSGDGAELRTPLGISIVGGLLVSQLLTLYTTPVVYLFMDKLRRNRRPASAGAASRWRLFGKGVA
jgi:hypothetical protein